MPRLYLSAALLALMPAAATAQSSLSWLDLITPDRLVQSLAQTGIMMLRTQMDVKYSDMSVDLIGGRVTLTDVQVWPLPEWDHNGDCEIDIDRLTLRTAPLDQLDRIRFKAQITGASAPGVCLPPDARQGLAMAGLDAITVPRLTVDLEYGVPASDATVRLFGTVEGAATIDLSADMAYVWLDGRDNMDSPTPVVFLNNATAVVENHGIWQAMKGQLPPPFTNPQIAAQVVSGALEGALTDLNRQARSSDGNADSGALTGAQRVFLDSIVSVWPTFLQAPESLVLETDIEGDVYIDFAAIGDDPRELFEALHPHLALVPARASQMLPTALLSQAMGPHAENLPEAERRTAGMAMVTGVGAPRNIDVGSGLLQPLAEAGDGEVAMALSEALEGRAPEDAYRWALVAGRAGQPGATARLDRLEHLIPFARILELQAEVSGGDTHPGAALKSIALIREQAAMRLSGQGQARSYGTATMWAILAKAAGDPEAGDILADVDEHIRLAGPGAQDAWRGFEDEASGLAMQVWIGQDLPSKLGR